MRLESAPFLALALACSGVASAQNFNYPDFSSTAGLTLNGNAAPSGSALRVSSAVISDKGSAFQTLPVSVAGGFDTTIEFLITGQVSGGADGLAFVIHNDPRGPTALGDHAAVMGYGVFMGGAAGIAIANSLVVELDTYFGGMWGDFNDNHISIHTLGTAENSASENFSIGWVVPAINMSDSQVHKLRVRYVPGTLEVYLDDVVNPAISTPYDFSTGGNYVGGGSVGGLNLNAGTSAYVGFTAAAGGVWENHDVLSWDWTSGAACPPAATYCTTLISSSGCVPSIGSTGSASLANPAAFVVSGSNLEDNKNGLVFFGTTGQNNAPFFGGTLCVLAPLYRLPVQNSQGAGSCTGTISNSLVDFLNHPSGGSAVVAGATVQSQVWYRDPQAALTVGLSNGLEFTICP